MLDLDQTEPSQLTAALGERLRALRLQRNVTQSTLARLAGLSRLTVLKLETGRGTLDSLARIMVALGREPELAALFAPDPAMTLEDLTPRPRRRAHP